MKGLKNKLSFLLGAALVIYLLNQNMLTPEASADLTISGIGQDAKKLFDDLLGAIKILVPASTVVAFIYFAWRKSIPLEEQGGADVDYSKRMKKTLLWGLIATLGSQVVDLIYDYFTK